MAKNNSKAATKRFNKFMEQHGDDNWQMDKIKTDIWFECYDLFSIAFNESSLRMKHLSVDMPAEYATHLMSAKVDEYYNGDLSEDRLLNLFKDCYSCGSTYIDDVIL